MSPQPKKIGLTMATIMGLNAMIGAGIFTIPEQLQRTVGPAGILAYVLVSFAVWCVASTLGRMSAYYEYGGSFYTYVSSWAGHKAGIAATLVYCTGLIVAMGLLTHMTAVYLNGEIPAVSPELFAVLLLTALVLSLFAGMRSIRSSQIILFILTLAPLGIITALCLSRAQIANLTPFMPHGFSSVLSSTKIIIFGFFGFESITALHAFVAQPAVNVPRTITRSALITGAVYTGFVTAVFLGIPHELFARQATLPAVLHTLFPAHAWLIGLVTWGIIITIMGTIHSLLWGVSSIIRSIPKLINAPATSRSTSLLNSSYALLFAGLGAWLCNALITQIDLFFGITTLLLIPVLAASIIPCAIKKIPVTRTQHIIAFVGLATLGVMFAYAGRDVIYTLIR